MQFTAERTEADVTERDFAVTVAGERVPGVLWTPAGATEPRPLILVGHGRTQHKRAESVLALTHPFVRNHGYAVAAIDAPEHGDRTTPEATAAALAEITERMTARTRASTAERNRQHDERAARAAPEWRATLDALAGLDVVDAERVGYWGLSMGTSIGVPWIAADARVRCAVLGLFRLAPGMDAFGGAARAVTVPALFVLQWHDELINREHGLALYDALGSREKTLHVNPGGHGEVPDFEQDACERFFARHLGSAPPRASR